MPRALKVQMLICPSHIPLPPSFRRDQAEIPIMRSLSNLPCIFTLLYQATPGIGYCKSFMFLWNVGMQETDAVSLPLSCRKLVGRDAES